MKYEILPSGNYRVKRFLNGKRYSLTFKHIPTESEITQALVNKASNISVTAQEPQIALTFAKAVKEYITLKKDRNSASTLKEYDRLPKRFSEEFCNKSITDITQLDVDKEVAAWLKKKLSYKTIVNYFRMMQTVIKKFGGIEYSEDMLPEKPKKEEPYIPTSEDVSKMLPYIRDNYPMHYILFWISCYGLRRGEICALTLDDIDFENAIIHVRKDMVQDSNLNWVIKEPKTQASKRDVPISKDLSELIRLSGCVYRGHPNSISKVLSRTQDALGIPRFSLHKMRHYCCSELFDMEGVTETDVMYLMGWAEESDVMRQVYKHSRLKNNLNKQRSIADKLAQRMSTNCPR